MKDIPLINKVVALVRKQRKAEPKWSPKRLIRSLTYKPTLYEEFVGTLKNPLQFGMVIGLIATAVGLVIAGAVRRQNGLFPLPTGGIVLKKRS